MTPCFPPMPFGQRLHCQSLHTYLATVCHVRGCRRASFPPLLAQVCSCRNRGVYPHSDMCGDSTMSSPITQLALVKGAKRPALRLWLSYPGLWDQRPPRAEGLCYLSPSRRVHGEARAHRATVMRWWQKCL